MQRDSGARDRIAARKEIIVSCGSVDTPRLLLYSGIGPRKDLDHHGIDVVRDLPGVGENLIDHPESIIIWKLRRPMGPEGCMDADCALFVNRLGIDDRPDLMYHTYQLPFTFNTERLGYEVPDDRWCICMTPNIPRSHSAGRLYLLSRNPDIKPALDFRYFTDEDGYDEQTIVDGLKLAREVAAAGPFADWIEREIAPGPEITSDADLSTYGRAVHHTVYHPSGTCKMGAADDETAVVTPDLTVHGIAELSIAFVDDEIMRGLNRKFRRKNKTTDVLTFPDEIVISLDQARRQARDEKHSLATEVRYLIVHGILHALGYDHETDDGEMNALELRVRGRVGLE